MFGDSITERWNGRDFGRTHNDAYKNNSLAFQKLFQKQYGAKVQGLALGIAADHVSLETMLYVLRTRGPAQFLTFLMLRRPNICYTGWYMENWLQI